MDILFGLMAWCWDASKIMKWILKFESDNRCRLILIHLSWKSNFFRQFRLPGVAWFVDFIYMVSYDEEELCAYSSFVLSCRTLSCSRIFSHSKGKRWVQTSFLWFTLYQVNKRKVKSFLFCILAITKFHWDSKVHLHCTTNLVN